MHKIGLATVVTAALALACTSTKPATASVLPVGYTDDPLIDTFGDPPFYGIIHQEEINPCTFVIVLVCGTTPASVSYTLTSQSASAMTDGMGGSALSFEAFGTAPNHVRVETTETGFYVHSASPNLIKLRAFFPTISITGQMDAGNSIAYGVSIEMYGVSDATHEEAIIDDGKDFLTEGMLTGSDSFVPTPTTSGEDIGAVFNGFSTLEVTDYVLDWDLGMVSGNGAFAIRVEKWIDIVGDPSTFIEIVSGTIEDPNGIAPRLSVTATPVGATAMPAAPAAVLFLSGLLTLAGLRRFGIGG